MALAATTQILQDGPRNVVMKFTGVSDGNGESAVLKVDVDTLLNSPDAVRIEHIDHTMYGLQVRLLWGASSNQLILVLSPEADSKLNLRQFGGIVNNAGAGKTGDILFTTEALPGGALAAGANYTIILSMVKVFDRSVQTLG